ncbi:MAG: hypothetical protein HKO65_20050, partial [Gemmatimonadetes bacterium]|nr:hypothetical protein [Gemmatimonadota bacterium]
MKRFSSRAALLFTMIGCSNPGTDSANQTFLLHLSQDAASEIAVMGLEVPITGRAYVILS